MIRPTRGTLANLRKLAAGGELVFALDNGYLYIAQGDPVLIPIKVGAENIVGLIPGQPGPQGKQGIQGIQGPPGANVTYLMFDGGNAASLYAQNALRIDMGAAA